jgi:hypothetical protein
MDGFMSSLRSVVAARWVIGAAVFLLVFSPQKRAVAERISTGPVVLNKDGKVELALQRWPRGSRLEIPWDGGPIAAATLSQSPHAYVQSWELRPNEGTLRLILKRADNAAQSAVLSLESLSKTCQYPDGRYVFAVADAQMRKIAGTDRAYRWDFDVSRPGNYSVEVTGQAGDFRGQPVEVVIGDSNAEGMLEDTGRRARVVNTAIGQLRLSQPGPQHLVLKVGEGRGEARYATVLAVILRPASEGVETVQDRDSSVILHARNATIHGVKAQYHPEPHVDAVAFWTEPSDWVSWTFNVKTPGRFDVELMEACANGQGGSEVEVSVGDRTIRSVIPETGGWQRFQSRVIGEVELSRTGEFRLAIKPLRKAGDAVMDLRQVRLVPKTEVATAKRDPSS